MVARPCIPQGIALGGKGLGGVYQVAGVHHGGLAVQVQHEGANVVVVVALAVVPALGHQDGAAALQHAHLQAGQPHILGGTRRGGGLRRMGMEQLLQKPPQERRVADLVGGLLPQRGPHGGQMVIMKALACVLQPLAADERPGVAVREIDKPAVGQLHGGREGRNAPDFLLRPEGHPAPRQLLEGFQAVQHGAARHVPVARALVAAAVLGHHVQPAIQHAAGPVEHLAQAHPVGYAQGGRQHHVGDNPGRPVVQILADEPHPPVIVPGGEGGEDAALDFQPHPAADHRRDPVQAVRQQGAGQGENHPRLRGEQVDIGVGHIRQGALGRGTHALVGRAVVRADDPGGFLADAPQAVDYIVQVVRPSGDATAQQGGNQLFAAQKVWIFIRLAAAAAYKGHELGGGQHGVGNVAVMRRHAHKVVAVLRRYAFPGGAVAFGRKGTERRAVHQAGKRMRIQKLSKHRERPPHLQV